jgi:CrcB protein
MPNLLLVMIGGAIGAGFRYHVGRITLHLFGPHFPWGTWIVNLVGGLLMGILAGVLARDGVAGEPLRLFLGVGVLGGFTTFSAFSLDVTNMIYRGDLAIAGAYALSSVAGSVMMLFVGLWLARVAAA